ncbi:DUF2490 domain-containing protein [Lutimonas halocynthiae]|uniref:DUF2490 domain-containing protein n=1 Tax=Lutimonas halocynthiae TaxID=1446477 RepID=UPI0025B3759B|nr:DUF2490 domain-containing protein [Lutimonas halocynthiae]MDN3641913.1 DUF2490 domain-containing protein [Lutimonas halocynthiae]
MAQESGQIWFEYKPAYSFSKGYKLGMRASLRTNLEDPRWRTFEVRFMPEKKLNLHFDILASLQFLETLQYKGLTTSEIRFSAGGRYHFLPGKRIKSGVMARIEFRNIYKKEAMEWTYATRPRLQFFASMPLNEKSMSPDHVWYITSFVEFFYQNEDDVQERYANRYWIRLGLGYKINKKIQLELLYNRQDSKNTITDGYEDLSKENILVFSFKHKLH